MRTRVQVGLFKFYVAVDVSGLQITRATKLKKHQNNWRNKL